MHTPKIELPSDGIATFCECWKIVEFALFGSVLSDDFRPDSDVDVLVTFAPEARWILLDFVRMKQDLETILARKVDLVSRRGVEASHNYIRRQAILSSAQVVHVAR